MFLALRAYKPIPVPLIGRIALKIRLSIESCRFHAQPSTTVAASAWRLC